MRKEAERQNGEATQHQLRLVERRKPARSQRDQKPVGKPSSSSSSPHQTDLEGAQFNVNEHSTEDEHLDVIAEEGTSEMLRTEGVAVEAVELESRRVRGRRAT